MRVIVAILWMLLVAGCWNKVVQHPAAAGKWFAEARAAYLANQ